MASLSPFDAIQELRYTWGCSRALYNSYREDDAKVANQVGKRYVCTKCGSEMIVTKGGNGTLSCCGQPMSPKS